jgi:hypothetical protein
VPLFVPRLLIPNLENILFLFYFRISLISKRLYANAYIVNVVTPLVNTNTARLVTNWSTIERVDDRAFTPLALLSSVNFFH